MLKILVLMVSMGLLRLKSVNGSNDLNGQKGLYDLRGLNGLFSMGLKDFMGLTLPCTGSEMSGYLWGGGVSRTLCRISLYKHFWGVKWTCCPPST